MQGLQGHQRSRDEKQSDCLGHTNSPRLQWLQGQILIVQIKVPKQGVVWVPTGP